MAYSLRCRDIIVETYGEWWFRLWMIFLAWSTSVCRRQAWFRSLGGSHLAHCVRVVAAQGSSTVFMITSTKNHAHDARSVKDPTTAAIDRTGKWVGKNPVAVQQ